MDSWIRDQLHDVVSWLCSPTCSADASTLTSTSCDMQLGYYDKTLAQYILALANKASSSKGLLEQLIANDVPPGPKAEAFAQQLFQKTRGASGGGGEDGERNMMAHRRWHGAPYFAFRS